jgi:hypothetical protein
MLGQAKPFASLSSTLLARKGTARPAMRPQGFASLAPSPQALEDLGWNDMGDHMAAPAEPTPITPAVAPVTEAAPPPVVAVQEALREEFAPEPAPVPEPQVVRSVSVATAGRLQRETAHKGRAAFTLRLDAARHLKLRLASAVTHQSAQQLVTHAVDRFLATLPEVDALVAQLPDTPARKRKR